jgi:putative transposase
VIRLIFDKKKKKAGARTIKMIAERDYKLTYNLKRISRIKKKFGFETIIRRKSRFRYIAKGGDEHVVAPNFVQRQFDAAQMDQVYSTDITYLDYGLGQRAYLSAVKDLCTKEIVNYTVSKNLHMNIVVNGLDKLFGKLSKRVRRNLIVHSDQGSHYTSKLYRDKLSEYEVIQSMSRRGNCLDNAPIESFFGHMKDEIDVKNCKSYSELRNEVKKFVYQYNYKRPQWSLKRQTPAECRGLINF